MYKPLLIIVMTFAMLSGCSSFLTLFQNQNQIKIKEQPKQAQYCRKIQKLNIVHQDKKKVLQFEQSLLKIEQRYHLNFVEKAVLWSIYQLAFSPEKTSPSSRFQVVLGKGKDFKIYDFNTLDPRIKMKNTYLGALQALLNFNKNKRNLYALLKLAHQYFPKKLVVNEQLADFIQLHRTQLIKKKSHTKKLFFKAETPLQEGESIPRVHLLKSLPQITKTKQKIPKAPLFPVNLPSEVLYDAEVYCNIDLNLYSNSIYLIEPNNKLINNTFSLYSDKNEYFIAAASFIPDWDRQENSSYLIPSKQAKKPISICLSKKPKNNAQAFWLAFNGRDPGQHLHHLLHYGISSAQSINEFQEFIRYPRHQFLTSPPRLIYESKRGGADQLNSFLKLDFPVYNAKQLAEIWSFKYTPKKTFLITDDRRPTYQSCLK